VTYYANEACRRPRQGLPKWQDIDSTQPELSRPEQSASGASEAADGWPNAGCGAGLAPLVDVAGRL
jgi:hypothetical protein